MKPIILLILVCIIEFLLAPRKEQRYRNVDSLIAAFFVWAAEIVADILISIINPAMHNIDEYYYLAIIIQGAIVIGTGCISRHNDSFVKYGMPPKYTTGIRSNVIGIFYNFDSSSPIVYTKNFAVPTGIALVCCDVALSGIFIWQSYSYTSYGNTLLLPYAYAGLLSLLTELAIFCLGRSKWKDLLEEYRRKKVCSNKREFAKSRYALIEDPKNYKYIFMRNFVTEPDHITRAAKFNWKKDVFKNSITYYNFEDHSQTEYKTQEHNEALESFIELNNLEVNECYVAAYNLIDRDQNVLLKTPSYVDFEPYLTSMIKIKVAKTQKVVLIVSGDEKKQITVQKIKNSFKEYFGFKNLPLITDIGEYVEIEEKRAREKEKHSKHQNNHTYLDAMVRNNYIKEDIEPEIVIKSPDIVIATAEDVCDPDYTDYIRNIVTNLGLIIYYDFGDAVQEEALFAKIVHSVLDFDDKIATLYMSDGFFDLEQVVDNFFSRRNIYRIVVPRKPSNESYITGWKAETLSSMQSRTIADPSRNIGNHIPILCDCTNYTRNDLMIVEDEYDTYAENELNIVGERIASRFDHHVGWNDVLGGNCVICSVSDTHNNAAHTYLAMQGIGEKTEYINIISRPYLLRNYLMYHLRHFTLKPGVLASYSPGMIKTSRAIAYEAVIKAYITGCTKEQLEAYMLSTSLPTEGTPEEMLKSLVMCACTDKNADITAEITKDANSRYYIDKATYSFIVKNSGLMEKVEFVTNNQTIIRNQRRYSYLIPHQKIVVGGVKYTVEAIKGNRVELTDSNIREPMYVTRPVRTCKVSVHNQEDYGVIVQNSSDTSLAFKRLVCDVDLDVYGTIIFKNSYHPFYSEARYDYQKSMEKQHREYKDVNVFCIKIGSPYLNASNHQRIEHLFALLLNEMLPTFFPKHSERIIVGCSTWNIESNIENANITTNYMAAQMNIDGIDEIAENEMCLYILEDSPLETGLVNVFWQDEEFRYMLKILEDYLYYQEMIHRQEAGELFDASDKEHLHLLRKILLKVANETYEYQNSNGEYETVYFNSIRAARNKFNQLEISKSFNLSCDFCGKPISPESNQNNEYHYYAYSGMISCKSCFEKSVCSEKHSQSDIRIFEAQINQWFLDKYKEVVTADFYNYLEDAEFLSDTATLQNRFITTDDADEGGVLGLSWSPDGDPNIISVCNREYIPITHGDSFKEEEDAVRSSYYAEDKVFPYILIRNGLSHIKYMGVLCHEMTHQWQHENLDMVKVASGVATGRSDEFGQSIDLRTMRIEGHAEWERIRYLSAHKVNTYVERKTLEATQNAYGIGYIWMCHMMKVGNDDLSIPVERTKEFIKQRNRFQRKKNSFGLMRLYFGNGAVSTEGDFDTETTTDNTDSGTENIE